MISSAKGNADRHRLAARFVDGPHVSAPDKAEQRLKDWLTDLGSEQADAIGGLIARLPRAKTILSGVPEPSPYLFDLVRADGARALRLLECDPEPYLAQLIEDTSRVVLAASSEADVMRLLRHMKSEAALLIALCDIGGVWPVMAVTAALTDLAVCAVAAASRAPPSRVAGRFGAAARSGFEGGGGLGAGGAVLLWAGRAGGGARGGEEGAALRRRRDWRRVGDGGNRAVRLAQASG